MAHPALLAVLLLSGMAATPEDSEPHPLLHPGGVDLRVEGAVSLPLLYVQTGATVDVGVLPLGPGTLALGVELGFNLCATACWVPNLVLERHVSRYDLSALGRLGYHFTVDDRNYRRVDFHGVLAGGVMEARTTFTGPDYRVEGRGRGPSVSLGLGGNYFPRSRFFVGAEVQLHFATGLYALDVTRGTYVPTDEDRRWIQLGLGSTFFLGFRLF